jgi:cytochrome c peroxidase
MANATPRAFAKKLEAAAYASDVRALFGADVFDDPESALQAATFALQRFEIEDASFNAFSSKYDAFLRGLATLTSQEQRGLALYVAPTKGNCAACHPSSVADGQLPLFTDFTYDNLGIPRNPDIPANDDPAYFDLGLCGPDRTDLAAGHADLCGAFKVPTLRNIALTAPYFHNGRFATLKETLQFYVRRDTNPEEFYPTGPGGVEKFDDLPAEFHRNVNTTEAPYNRRPGDAPALTDAEIDDVIAFLNTLTDGYTP